MELTHSYPLRLIGPSTDDVVWWPSVPPVIMMPVPVDSRFFASPAFRRCATIGERLIAYQQAATMTFVKTGEVDDCGFAIYRSEE